MLHSSIFGCEPVRKRVTLSMSVQPDPVFCDDPIENKDGKLVVTTEHLIPF